VWNSVVFRSDTNANLWKFPNQTFGVEVASYLSEQATVTASAF
jgi:hypothetical protein